MATAVILNSRQSKMPVGDDPWVVSTLKAVRHAADRGYTVLSSAGLSTWELVTWAAGVCGGKVQLHVPCPFRDTIAGAEVSLRAEPELVTDLMCREFDLDLSRTEFRFHRRDPTTKRKQFWPERDEKIIDLADIVYPVSLRPGGTLERLLRTCGSGKTIDEQFRVPYRISDAGRRITVAPQLDTVSAAGGPWPYITHWTRLANGKWPGETAAAYYRDVVHSGDTYARSAPATLIRIIKEKCLRASTTHIRGRCPVVSFTALPPGEAVKLMRWRKRFVRWNFEPDGLAIREDVARSIGMRPVIYGVPADYARLDEADQPFFQNRGVRGGDWEPEHEWRHLGDLDFTALPPEALKIIVCTPGDGQWVRQVTNVEIEQLFTT